MKISIIGPTHPYRSGISHYNTLLCDELKRYHDISLYSFSRQYPGFLFPGTSDIDTISRFQLKEDRAQYTIDSLNPVTWFSTLHKIRKDSPDLIIAHWWTTFWGPLYITLLPILKKMTGAKILLICHNVEDHENSSFKRLIAKKVFPVADFHIVHSEECKNRLAKMLPGTNAEKVFHPLYSVFNRNRISPEKARERLKLSGNVMLFFGIIRKYKGLRYLLEAMPFILKKTDLTLIIAGEFWEGKDYYLHLIKEKGLTDKIRVIDRFIPNEDIEIYFKAADAVVLPYVKGTGSGVAQLALAFGVPIIATKVGSLPEIVEDGKTGYLVEPENPEELADKVIKYFKSGKKDHFVKNMGQGNRIYSWKRLREAIESLL
ncbi:MAG: glycosyltransferase [Candidatus Omnitrophica bacterium]|nr:glycosyltransferase [Candidatus Omnitrophota bacterium]MBU4488707.1 glycosyltransferase [Candidatus Omnitrophota bacterium]MCG2705736.1 glycosyltransferase [Candidatus Omnitrophota bacterium]